MLTTDVSRKHWLAVMLAIVAVIGMGTLAAAGAELSLAGTWRGAIEIPGQPLDIQFQFVQDGDSWKGTGDIPPRPGRFRPNDRNISVSGEQVSVRLC